MNWQPRSEQPTAQGAPFCSLQEFLATGEKGSLGDQSSPSLLSEARANPGVKGICRVTQGSGVREPESESLLSLLICKMGITSYLLGMRDNLRERIHVKALAQCLVHSTCSGKLNSSYYCYNYSWQSWDVNPDLLIPRPVPFHQSLFLPSLPTFPIFPPPPGDSNPQEAR